MPRRIVRRAVRRGVRRSGYRSGRTRRAAGIFILFRLLRRMFR